MWSGGACKVTGETATPLNFTASALELRAGCLGRNGSKVRTTWADSLKITIPFPNINRLDGNEVSPPMILAEVSGNGVTKCSFLAATFAGGAAGATAKGGSGNTLVWRETKTGAASTVPNLMGGGGRLDERGGTGA